MTSKTPALGLAALAAVGALVWAYTAEHEAVVRPTAAPTSDNMEASDTGVHETASVHAAAEDASVRQHQGACASVLAGAEVGTSYRYTLETPRARQQLLLRLDERNDEQGARADTWHVSLEAEGEPTLEDDLVRHCDARGEADFWGPLGVPGITEISEPTWRWPARLHAGQTFEGDVTTRVGDDSGTSHRKHRVVGREAVSVPAGDFDCWRVEVVEQLAGDPDLPGTLWIADGVGLVRSRREYLPGEEETVELVSVEQAS